MIALTQGFRPFFLAAGVWAATALLLWLCVLAGVLALPSRFDPVAWHVHEMLFGFVPAGICGFLLTAIPNWTGRRYVSGAALGGLAALWLAGRIACLLSALLPAALAVGIDLAFPLALIVVAARELIAAGNRRNLPLLAPLSLLAIGNLLMHLQALGVAVPPGLGWRLGLMAALILISAIAGRIVPAFTRNWLVQRGAASLPGGHGHVDRAALATLLIGLAVWTFLPDAPALGALLLVAAALNLWRLARWRGGATFAEPLLFVLHVGYLWLVAGVALLGLSLLLPAVPTSAAVHALAGGAVGTMMLAVMTRATRGHTGRALHADTRTIAMFALVTAAALARVVATWIGGFTLLVTAGVLWTAAFLLFAMVYGPMLMRSRPGS